MTDGGCAPAGYSVFVVGVADVDMTELRLMGSKPSERHVFVVDDYDAFAKIQDNLITFICETATSSKADSRVRQAFRPALGLNECTCRGGVRKSAIMSHFLPRQLSKAFVLFQLAL